MFALVIGVTINQERLEAVEIAGAAFMLLAAWLALRDARPRL